MGGGVFTYIQKAKPIVYKINDGLVKYTLYLGKLSCGNTVALKVDTY